MAFSKFDPHRPEDGSPTTPDAVVAERRARLLKWSTWITWAMTALGFGFIAYWTFR